MQWEIEIKNNEKASEIDVHETETINMINEILDQIKVFEAAYETKTEALKADKKLDEDARLKAMESFAETKTKKRWEKVGPSSSKQGHSAKDTLEYLKEIGHRKEEQNE